MAALDVVLTADEVAVGKPDPASFLLGAQPFVVGALGVVRWD